MLDILIVGLVIAAALAMLLGAQLKAYRQTKMMQVQSKEIQKHALELEERNKQLLELNHEKTQIISLVSHDLKGPFNRIFALIQLMNLTQENLTHEQKEYLDKIHQISADGLSMIRNLLDNRRLDDKGIELNPVSIELSALILSLIKNYRSIAEKKKIGIEVEIAEPVTIKADKLYLGRVIENLVSNAIKFSPEGKRVFIKLATKPEVIELIFEDQGPGISEEDQKKLYHRFQRLSARPTGGESSTGLGLFIVKTILDKIGAEIYCDSELGKGARFTVSLPKKTFN